MRCSSSHTRRQLRPRRLQYKTSSEKDYVQSVIDSFERKMTQTFESYGQQGVTVRANIERLAWMGRLTALSEDDEDVVPLSGDEYEHHDVMHHDKDAVNWWELD